MVMKSAVLLLLASSVAAQVVFAPQLIYRTEPEYTAEARQKGVEGVVKLYAEIAPDGRAHRIRVLHSLGSGLDEKAIEAVRQWRFRPGTKDGHAVTSTSSIEVRFRLSNSAPAKKGVRV